MKNKLLKSIFVTTLVVIVGFGGTAIASHSWEGYHWARTSNPFTLQLGDNVTSAWDNYLITASNKWSLSEVLDTTIVSGLTTVKTCKPVWGRIEVCNSKYGNNGWLGVAQIWITGGNHITQATTKLNDTYFLKPQYNTSAWRNLVVCQEVGHTFGLDHQDEVFNNPNLGTCMDYTNNPSTNQYPNAHDYEQLANIYAHLDESSTIVQATAKSGGSVNGIGANLDNPSSWGRAIAKDHSGKDSVFELDLGNGNKILTHVFWVE